MSEGMARFIFVIDYHYASVCNAFSNLCNAL